MLRKVEAFFTRCSLTKYLIKISFIMISEEAERKDVAELERLMLELGLTSTIAEENRKKS
jgi:hypothetical protein